MRPPSSSTANEDDSFFRRARYQLRIVFPSVRIPSFLPGRAPLWLKNPASSNYPFSSKLHTVQNPSMKLMLLVEFHHLDSSLIAEVVNLADEMQRAALRESRAWLCVDSLPRSRCGDKRRCYSYMVVSGELQPCRELARADIPHVGREVDDADLHTVFQSANLSAYEPQQIRCGFRTRTFRWPSRCWPSCSSW